VTPTGSGKLMGNISKENRCHAINIL